MAARFFRSILFIGGILLTAVLFLFFPLSSKSLVSNPQPAQSYGEATEWVNNFFQNQELSDLNPDCRTQFMTHGQIVEKAILFVHGYTSCPAQFHELGKTFYDLGYNVLILPLPHHGLADRMTTEQEQITAEELVQYADTVVDIGQGLGEHLTIVGFSGGGTVAAWAAQTRSDIDFAVLISPGFGYLIVPTPLTLPATRLALILPNKYQWWDAAQEELGGLDHSYPRRATRALAQILRLGFAVRARAHQTPPQAGSILIVTNGNEPSVNNALTDELARVWMNQGAEITRYNFAKDLGLAHDLIDPEHPYGHPEIVYPILIPLIKR